MPCMLHRCSMWRPWTDWLHRRQKRLASLPNILIVRVDRNGGVGSSAASLPVLVEDQLAFPTLGPNLELASVLFESQKCMCACRCGEGDFWWFDAGRACHCLGQSVCGILKHKVSVVVYERPNGEAEFLGGRCDVVAPSRPCQTFGAGVSSVGGTRVAPRAQSATDDQFERGSYRSV